jgi:S-adenosylmethionine/arginine decarboxylase-like enzyme
MKDTEDYRREFEVCGIWGLQTCLDIHSCDYDLIRDAQAISEFVIKLCDLIGMKRYGDPVIVHFGEDERVEGYSMTQLIETSLISGHFANQTNNVYLDIFSCKFYDPLTVIKFAGDFFKGKSCNHKVIFRK